MSAAGHGPREGRPPLPAQAPPVGADPGRGPDGAVAAALALARSLGLPAERGVLLHAGSNTAVRLDPVPVVARSAHLTARVRPRPDEALRREVALARWLAARGAAVLPPTSLVDAGPHEAGGRVTTLWPLLDGAPATGAPSVAAAALAALHDALRGAVPGGSGVPDLPGLATAVADAGRALAACGARVPRAERERLLVEGEWAAAAAAEVDADPSPGAWGRQALHGDAHPRNLVRVGGGSGGDVGRGESGGSRGAVLWCDLEDALRGPVEWDLAVLAASRHHDGAAALVAHTALTSRVPDGALLAVLTRLRTWQAACWRLLAAS